MKCLRQTHRSSDLTGSKNGVCHPFGMAQRHQTEEIYQNFSFKKGASGVSFPLPATNVALVGKAVGHT